MKRLILSFAFTLFSLASFSQNYNFSYFKAAYVPISNDTILTPPTAWKNYYKRLYLPFAFSMFNESVDSCSIIGRDGNIFFDASIHAGEITPGFSSAYRYIDKNYSDTAKNQKEAGSKISVVTEGTISNRIFKVQFSDLKFNKKDTDITISYQIWFYEKDKSIEFRYDSNLVNNYYDTLFGGSLACGIIGYPHTLVNPPIKEISILLKNNAEAPVSAKNASQNKSVRLTSCPSGIVYRFASQSTNIMDNTTDISIFPNPVSSILYINSTVPIHSIYIYDLQGNLVLSDFTNLGVKNILDVHSLPIGNYILKTVDNNGETGSLKFSK